MHIELSGDGWCFVSFNIVAGWTSDRTNMSLYRDGEAPTLQVLNNEACRASNAFEALAVRLASEFSTSARSTAHLLE